MTPKHVSHDGSADGCADNGARRSSLAGCLSLAKSPFVLGMTPCEFPDARMAVALHRAGAVSVLDLGRERDLALRSLAEASEHMDSFGVRLHSGGVITVNDLPESVDLVVLPPDLDPAAFRPREIFVRVNSLAEARAAESAGVDALIAAGNESAGRIGGDSSFVLSQQLIQEMELPVWVQGGIGLHTAPACMAGGAAGVVIDTQLALLRESSLPSSVKEVIATMDGSETTVLAGHRVYSRPDLVPLRELADADEAAVVANLRPRNFPQSLLPIGQDGAFAKSFEERFGTAGGFVQALHRATEEHLRAAKACDPLAPDAPFARELGTKYPIVQGPMTRVSDRAAFADAVSCAGGLPFLAMSLMAGDQADELLAETAELLGDRPWGAGILGFVPKELRDAQFDAIERHRPGFALIAGGRPSQAHELEQRGITTYLHVPSPGLLDLFLKDGARKFVFEGRECGGHVGPRSSFVLWESQIERLLAFKDVEDVTAIFAGGIHDARSAAMIAALCGPLAERGAKVGILMGTAYLFTEEAVSVGAILPGYQGAAIECEATTLLETGPGHSTRCAETHYVRHFRDEKRRLEQAELDSREVWESLERLNLGRLRIASRGLKREGGEFRDVDEAEQKQEGLYMIGQVAQLRDRVVTMPALHEDVSAGSSRWLETVSVGESKQETEQSVDIAIIGMACIFPGAPDTETYWANVASGVNSITEVPSTRWSKDTYFDPEGAPGVSTPSKWGGFIDDVLFDPAAYGIPPKSLASIEPVQLLTLEVARRAIADAGYATREFDRGRTSVVIGAEAGTDLSGAYGFRALFPQYAGELPDCLDEVLPSPTEDTFPGILANVIAGRIANRLDLGGVNYTIDAACASSLAAVHSGVQLLASGSSDMALVGGADLHNSISDYLM
ncbi:MAG: beta-ketoacyl synthase N-terminal-like domain-containing protein, partial [Planctomycetota bacterium]|nr:beta-ketoacyl synthase N-terminal-like domain-containing protein [Planctomycetota bacterium]